MNPAIRSQYGLDRLDPYRPGDDWFDAGRAMADGDARGTFLVAPATVDLSARDHLPFAVLSVLEAEPDLPATAETAVLVTRIESRTTWCVPLEAPRDAPRREEIDDEPDPLPPKAGVSIAVTHFDLLDRIPELPWRPGTLVLRLVRDGIESEASTVHLVPGALFDEPRARALLDTHRGPALPPPPPAPSGADAGWSAETPNVPDPDGLDLFIDEPDPLRYPPRVIARGAYTVPVRQIERTPKGERRALPDGRLIAASLPLTLVITGPRLIAPVVLRVRIDSHVLVEANGWPTPLPEGDTRARVRGQFNLDLGAFAGFPRAPGPYWVRAVMGAFDTGPQPYTLLDARYAPLAGDEPA